MYVFDVEVYKNFFSVIFCHIEDQFDCHEFVIFEDRDDRQKLIDFLSAPRTLIGYNNLNYDNAIINAVCLGYSNEQLYDLSKEIIDGDRYSERIKSLRYQGNYKSIDLMKIMAFDVRGISLKRVGINLRMPRIQELPIPHDSLIKPNQVDLLLDYNLNDVQTTIKMYWAIEKEVKLRDDIGSFFNVNLTSASRSRMGNLILEKMYSERTGLHPSRFKEARSFRNMVQVKDCIVENISFKSSILNDFLEEIKNLRLFKDCHYKYAKSILYADKIFNFGDGGLHSDDDSGIFESNDKFSIIDVDVDSFYPWIMIHNRIKPGHLRDEFFDIFKEITLGRMEAKKIGDKIKAEALKITINAVFGKLGYDKFWLYDPEALLNVTISGQLYLLMLIEELYESGFEILSANTDGVTCRVLNEKIDDYYNACNRWMEKTNFTLSWDKYDRYIRKDVNNYLAVKPVYKETLHSKDVKKKGLFEINPGLSKGYKGPVISKSLYEYFINAIPIEDTIDKVNVYDFLFSEKTDKKFNIIYRNGKDEEIQRANRFFVSSSGAKLYKVTDDKEIKIHSANVQILNDIGTGPYDVDYGWYKREIQKIINQIEPKVQQVSLF